MRLDKATPRIVPTMTVVVLAIVSVVPLGLGDVAAFALPLLPLAALHYWMHSQYRSVPVIAAFLTGLAIDVMSYGPLGFWPLLFLAGVSGTVVASALQSHAGRLARWGSFVVILSLVCLLAWSVASAYFGRAIDPYPMLATGLLVGAGYFLIDVALTWIDGATTPPRQLNLERST